MLLVLHQHDYVLQVVEIAEALAHGFRLRIKANQLPNDASQKLISNLRDQLPILRGGIQMVLVRRPSRLRSLNFGQSLIQIEVALLVILIEQSWQNYGFMLQKEFLH